ncbi:NDR1/HIN1-like protein 6 [Fagus crenata]
MYHETDTNPHSRETNPHFHSPERVQDQNSQQHIPQGQPHNPHAQQPISRAQPSSKKSKRSKQGPDGSSEPRRQELVPSLPRPPEQHYPLSSPPPSQRSHPQGNDQHPRSHDSHFQPYARRQRPQDHGQHSQPHVTPNQTKPPHQQDDNKRSIPISPTKQTSPTHQPDQDQHSQSHVTPLSSSDQTRPPTWRQPIPHRQTKRKHHLTWFVTVFCAILWVVIIVGGLIVLIVYLVYRPRLPRFDVSAASLNAAYLDMGYMLNADVTMLANFTNPNKKVRVDFSYMYIDLYYGSTLIATQYVPPFSAAKARSKFAYIHLVTSQVGIPLTAAQRLKKQIEGNAVTFQVKGYFRARSNLGRLLRYSYLLHTHCTILMAGPPTGALIRSECKTKH